jgi:hypothetical protein
MGRWRHEDSGVTPYLKSGASGVAIVQINADTGSSAGTVPPDAEVGKRQIVGGAHLG